MSTEPFWNLAVSGVLGGGFTGVLGILVYARVNKRKAISEYRRTDAETDLLFIDGIESRMDALTRQLNAQQQDNFRLYGEVNELRGELSRVRAYADRLYRTVVSHDIPAQSYEEYVRNLNPGTA